MHEYSKKICEHIKKVYGNPDKMTKIELDELGKWTDILEDLTKYDINNRVIEEMDEYEDIEYDGRMGYDKYRYKNGRFAPKGRGRRMGYKPYYRTYPEIDYDKMREEYPDILDDYRMGDYSRKMPSRYGNAYDKYDSYRKHYTETKDADSMKHMKESMNEWMEDVVDSAKDMWKNADANDRAVLKQRMTQLVQNMQ